MMSDLEPNDVRLALDTTEKPDHRAAAARRVAESDDPAAFDVLARLATDTQADSLVVKTAGECLARILIRQGTLGSQEYERVPLHDFRGEAYIAYDRTIAAHQAKPAQGIASP
jgi:hypothetical protein